MYDCMTASAQPRMPWMSVAKYPHWGLRLMGLLGSVVMGYWKIRHFKLSVQSGFRDTLTKLANASNTEIGPQIRLWALCKSQVKWYRQLSLPGSNNFVSMSHYLNYIFIFVNFVNVFIAHQHTDAWYWYSNSVRPSVCPWRSGMRWKWFNISWHFFTIR